MGKWPLASVLREEPESQDDADLKKATEMRAKEHADFSAAQKEIMVREFLLFWRTSAVKVAHPKVTGIINMGACQII